MKYLICGLYALIIGVIIQNIILEQKIIDVEHDVEVEVFFDPDTTLYNLPLNYENFKFACIYYELDHPEIIYAQGRLESANFTSNVYKEKNNFLGLYNSKVKQYYPYYHWTDCLRAYKKYVQNKWDKEEDYYDFLQRLPYAEDKKYVKKVKQLVNDTTS